MSVAWDVLCAWGVPDGALRARPAGPMPAAEVGGALTQLAGTKFQDLSTAQRECLLAWLRGFRHQWPLRFETIVAAMGLRAIADLEDAPFDPNRYLKLRRIAIANLAGSL
jgi:hypothetical protein